ncbi:hypothetical protein [Defluviitalea phaphyphila]|uniref:hypothetical protein n=1 Tax=Defluviitalea phaphyphila TaxID=1473580 RepID=UPI0007315D46|nr:hypothetical protein [Defluviitalea phaphyphila]
MKEKRIEQFLNKDVMPLFQEIMNKLVENLRKDIYKIKKDFKRNLEETVEIIKELQEKGELKTLGYLIITMLRTEIAQRNYKYRIKAYNKYLYFDINPKDITDIDVSYFYNDLDTMWDTLYKEAKKYFLYVTPNDVDNIIQILIEQIHNFMVYAYMEAVEEMDMETLMNTISVEDDFQLLIGEYMDNTIILYEKTKEEDIINT